MAKLSFSGFADHGFIPYPPEVMATETLEFLTDIVLTHNGTEDRTKNRSVARQKVGYKIRTDLLNRQSPFNLAMQNIRGKWGVPLWAEAQFVGTVSGTAIDCQTELSAFAAGDLVLVYQNKKAWEVSQVLSVGLNQLVLTPGIGEYKNALVVPVKSGIIDGDITDGASGYQSVYNMTFRVFEPKPYTTHLAPMFALDVSGSMNDEVEPGISRLERAKEQIYTAVEALKGARVNSNVTVDLSLCFWSTSVNSHEWVDATEDDFDEALAIIAAQNVTGGTNPDLAFQYANTFFGTTAPNPGNRKDIMFFITDAGASNTTAAETAADMIARTGQFAEPKDVDIYAINIDVPNVSEALKVDNASDGDIALVDGANPTEMLKRLLLAIEPVIGKQYDGFEVVVAAPIGSTGSFSKTVTKVEDTYDFDLGGFGVLSPWESARVGSSHGFFGDGLEGVLELKRFVYRRFGKHGTFLLPSFEHDIRGTSISGDSLSMFISDDDFAAYNTNRTDVLFFYTDGTKQANTITTVEAVPLGGFRLDFEDPIEKDLSSVEMVCYMGKARFDTDRIEISYIGDSCAEISVNMLELNE